MTLFKIKKQYLSILEELNETEGEITPEIAEKLAINEGDLKDKAVNYALYIKKLEADNKTISEEVSRLQELKARNSKKIDSLDNAIVNAMVMFGFDKVEVATLKLSLRKSESVNVLDETKLSDNFFTTKITKTVSKTVLKDALKSGANIQGAELVINQNLQIK